MLYLLMRGVRGRLARALFSARALAMQLLPPHCYSIYSIARVELATVFVCWLPPACVRVELQRLLRFVTAHAHVSAFCSKMRCAV